MKPNMKISVNAEDYGLERMELAAAGAIKYQLERMTPEDARVGLDNPAELLKELIKSIDVNDFGTGTLRVRKNIVDYVKSMNPTEILESPSEGFQRFLSDCRGEVEKGVD